MKFEINIKKIIDDVVCPMIAISLIIMGSGMIQSCHRKVMHSDTHKVTTRMGKIVVPWRVGIKLGNWLSEDVEKGKK